MRGAILADRSRQPYQLVLGQFAGKADRVDLDRRPGRFGLVRPDGVDRVLLERHEYRARLLGRGFTAP